ncbi:ubiquitin hydrolase, putative [Leishmania tarentolae]|uniref:Ubiquitin hydrolase, putative n=1 Tax=Leishmania tarentolae TaxID=5689 RepID=A0A640KC90_LEITA|nr:ubiquitin hydrolase, putative [Leishmania tarentolae]
MARLDPKHKSAAAVDAQAENDTTVMHQEPVPPPLPAAPVADTGPSASDVALGDPVEFVVRGVDSIERWRARATRLNLTQLGVSLVRGVVRRGRLSAPPIRVFTAETTAAARSAAEAEASIDTFCLSQPGPPGLHPHTPLERKQAVTQVAEQNQTAHTLALDGASLACGPAVHHPPHHHCRAPLSLRPSLARRALVQTASRASVPLYMGMLIAFIGNGVGSLYNTVTETAALDASSAVVGQPPVQAPASTSGAVTSSLPASRCYVHLSAEMSHALHEVHRAAAEVVCMIDHESEEIHALITAEFRSTGKPLACERDEVERVQDMRRAQLSRSCDPLSHLVANLYSLVSLLDFFAVESASLPAPTPRTAAATTAAGSGHSNTHTTNAGFLLSSSASEAVTVTMKECVASPVTVAAYADGNTPRATLTPSAVKKTVPDATPPTSTSHDLAAAPGHPYTTGCLHALFDASGCLPQSVWRVFSAVAATLSQFEVSWSLTTGDAQSRQSFNSTACLILSEDQRCLLLQLHRLCTHFIVLRHQVCALDTVSPWHFKVKQMLDWDGFLNADDPDVWSRNNGGIDRCDLHSDLLRNTYARGPPWSINSSNKMALQAVAACPYTSDALDLALRRIKEVSGIASGGSTVVGERNGNASNNGDASTPLSLLDSVAFAGTHTAFIESAAPLQSSSVAALSQISAVPGYVGLQNNGNTCFLNSIVQLLGSAVLFRDDLMARFQDAVFCNSVHADHHAPASAHAVDDPAMATLFTKYGCRLAVALLLGEMQWRGSHRHTRLPLLPDYLIRHLPPPFDDHRQHDASELWHALMDKLDAPSEPGGAVVARWFSGRTATKMTCLACQHTRTHTDTFWDLSIPLLPATSGSSAPVSVGSSAPIMAAETTSPGSSTVSPSRVVNQIQVQHFPGATAVTTTYVCSPASDFSANTSTEEDRSAELKAVEHAEEAAEGENITAPILHPIVSSSVEEPYATAPQPSSMAAADDAPKTLQHLLLHVLHPTLNKELLHGSNALDCEHCGRRTDTELTTRLVAHVRKKVESEVDAVAADVAEENVCVAGRARISSGAGAAAAACGSDAEHEPPTSHEADKRASSHGESECLAQDTALSRSLTNAAAGGGLPYYLAAQLNRFSYRRGTQSYDKIADGVPLNEVIVVPVYPEITVPPNRATSPSNSQGPNALAAVSKEEDGNAPANRTAAALHSSTPALPVWVAYRLQSIIIHSGPSPSSGHYFALTRSAAVAPAHVSADVNSYDEGGEHHTSAAADLCAMRAYVKGLGSALSHCLSSERHFTYAEIAHSEAGVGGAEQESSLTCAHVEGAGLQTRGGSSAASLSRGSEKTMQSPALSPRATLPTFSVSVSGDRLYENWVMLNDANVQPVPADKMRHILHGRDGGNGSASETPYLILYEKLPVAYAGTPARDALPEDAEVTVEREADAAWCAPARLQHLWETPHASIGASGVTSVGGSGGKRVHFAREVLRFFSARLRDKVAHAARSEACLRPPPVERVAHQRAPATAVRAIVSQSWWSRTTGFRDAARAAAANASLTDARKDAPTSLNGSGSFGCPSTAHRPHRLMATAKYANVLHNTRYSTSLFQRLPEHRDHGGAAVLSSSGNDTGSDADDERDEPIS